MNYIGLVLCSYTIYSKLEGRPPSSNSSVFDVVTNGGGNPIRNRISDTLFPLRDAAFIHFSHFISNLPTEREPSKAERYRDFLTNYSSAFCGYSFLFIFNLKSHVSSSILGKVICRNYGNRHVAPNFKVQNCRLALALGIY